MTLLRPSATLLCEGVSIDALTGRLTAFNILDDVVTQGFPAAMGRLVVVNIYDLDDDEHRFQERITVKNPAGEAIRESESGLALLCRTPDRALVAHHSIHALWRLRFDGAGDHEIDVSACEDGGEWQRVASRRLVVRERPHPLWAGPAAATEGDAGDGQNPG